MKGVSTTALFRFGEILLILVLEAAKPAVDHKVWPRSEPVPGPDTRALKLRFADSGTWVPPDSSMSTVKA